MISGIEKSTSSSVNEEIKDIIMSSYTQDELFQALLFSDLLEEVLSPIDVQALEDRSTEIKIRDAYFNYCNGKTDIVDIDKNSAYNLLDRYGEGLLGPDDEGLFLIDEEPGMFTAIDNTQGEMPISKWTKTAIIQAVKSYCFDFDLAYDPDIENNTEAELVKEFLEYKSWHHSSRTAREVEFFGLNEDAVCRSFEPMSQEQIIERDRQMAAEQAAQEARLQFMNAREKEFEQKFGCNPSSVLAYEAVHPEMCTRFIARRKKTEMISYRLPAEAVKAGMKEEQVCPLAYAGYSRVGYFDVFMQGTGKKQHWEDVDFEALTEKFDKAAEKGKRAKMQPKARLDEKKTCVDEAMRVMREQTDISGDKEQENQK